MKHSGILVIHRTHLTQKIITGLLSDPTFGEQSASGFSIHAGGDSAIRAEISGRGFDFDRRGCPLVGVVEGVLLFDAENLLAQFFNFSTEVGALCECRLNSAAANWIGMFSQVRQ